MPLDISSLRRKTQSSWEDLWNPKLSRYENTKSILGRIIILPDEEIQLPIAAIYMWLNSNWALQVPYLFSYGPEGSGKSAIATVAEKMLDIESLQAGSSAVAIRNEVNNSRFPDGEGTQENDSFFLVWDNVNQDTLENKDIYNIFLSGAVKGKDIVKISSSESGRNLVFRTFSPKIYSSIHALHARPDYRELTRRVMVLFHEKLSEETLGDRELLSSDEVDFSCFFESQIEPFFQSIDRFHAYEDFRRKWNKTRFSGQWDTARKRLLADFAATGYIIGAWEDIAGAKEVIGGYETYLKSKVGDCQTPLVQCLKDLAKIEDGDISAALLAAHVDLYLNNFKLLEKPRQKELLEAMTVLGYSFTKGRWAKQ